MSKEDTIFIRVVPEFKQRWIDFCEELGIKQTIVGERLLEWFMDQDEAMQARVMRRRSEPAKIAAKKKGPQPG